jgi:hypothetical protein
MVTRRMGGLGDTSISSVVSTILLLGMGVFILFIIMSIGFRTVLPEETLNEICKEPMMAITSKLGQPINRGYHDGLSRWTYIDHIYYFERNYSGQCRVTGERI